MALKVLISKFIIVFFKKIETTVVKARVSFRLNIHEKIVSGTIFTHIKGEY